VCGRKDPYSCQLFAHCLCVRVLQSTCKYTHNDLRFRHFLLGRAVIKSIDLFEIRLIPLPRKAPFGALPMAVINQRVLGGFTVAALCFSQLLFVPFVSGQVRSWDDAYALAANFTSDLSQTEKRAIMTGNIH